MTDAQKSMQIQAWADTLAQPAILIDIDSNNQQLIIWSQNDGSVSAWDLTTGEAEGT